jgi:hypothetical protein
MNVQLAVLADAGNVAPPGKLNILGIFDTLWVKQFPAVHPFMVLAMRLRFEYEDRAGEHSLEVILRDEDGKELFHAKAAVVIPQIPPGGFAHVNQVLNFAQTGFTGEGTYAFRILWDDVEKERVNLKVMRGPPAQRSAPHGQ